MIDDAQFEALGGSRVIGVGQGSLISSSGWEGSGKHFLYTL